MSEIDVATLSARVVLTAPHGRLAAILALATGGFAIGTGEFAIMGLLPAVAKNLHTTVPSAGWLISAYAGGVVVGAPLFAVLAARLSRRSVLIGLMLLYAVFNILTGLSHRYDMVLLFRFLAGLPHGAFFGIGALVAASMVERRERTRAVGQMMLGLTTATIIGAPLAAWCGAFIDWHLSYYMVGLIALLCVAGLLWALPPIPAQTGASPLTELGALGRVQVWLALGTSAVGFGGLFAVYSYITPALMHRTHMSAAVVPLVLSVMGLGMAAGNTVGAWLVDRAPKRAVIGLLIWDTIVLLLFVPALPFAWAATADAFLIGCGVALAPALQTRLMDVAGDAQSLAASLNHSAFNTANGLGAALAGIAISAGYGWSSPGWVGALLALGGLLVFLLALFLERKHPIEVPA
ncbi:MFS transporter [Acetobacteraceae bacterium KSS8]|uniref:MFS transporter n=1 Tax=Endosaccharibacter trunci TaxID=2812733 RepID=A0ABT1W942_9PROT|nr:MFS transporter [Acetobacteraceae bacterium KSS8]